MIDPIFEKEYRQRVVDEAKTWLWTPNHHLGRVRGPRGGCDCATLIAEVYGACKIFQAEVRNYNAQWFLHRNDEWYIEEVKKHFDEVPGPPDRIPKPGDLILFQVGRVYGHGVIVSNWTQIIHLDPIAGEVRLDDARMSPFLCGRRPKFYSVKGWS